MPQERWQLLKRKKKTMDGVRKKADIFVGPPSSDRGAIPLPVASGPQRGSSSPFRDTSLTFPRRRDGPPSGWCLAGESGDAEGLTNQHASLAHLRGGRFLSWGGSERGSRTRLTSARQATGYRGSTIRYTKYHDVQRTNLEDALGMWRD